MSDLAALETLDGYRRWFTSVAFWEAYVKQVCARHNLEPSDPVRVGVPGTCPTFIVAERWVIKFFGRLFDGGTGYMVEKEAGRLASRDPAIRSVPILASGELRPVDWPWPYLVYPFIPGASLGEQADLIDAAGWLNIASELGEIVRRLHALPLAGSAIFPDHGVDYRAFLEKQRGACVRNHRQWGSLPVHLIDQIEAFLPPVDELIDSTRPAHIIHADLTRDHLLGQAHNGRWNTLALIDFGDAMTGDLLYELGALHLDIFRADQRLLSAFLDSYGLKSEKRWDLPRRAMAAALLHQFNIIEMLPEELFRLPSLEALAVAVWET